MSDTSYIIDVAADMPEAGVTTAQLDELSQSLIDAGASAESLEAATMAVSRQLDAARSATEAANNALAEGNARYSELERAALNAAKAAEKAASQGKLDPAMARTAHEAAQALEHEAGALRHLETEAARAAKAEAKLAATHGNLKKLSGSAAGAFSEQAAAAKKSVKEAEGMVPLVKNFRDLQDAISTTEGQAILAVGAFAGVATAIVAVSLAAAAGVTALAAWGTSLANTKRDAGLVTEAAEALTPGLVELREDFAALSAETGAAGADMRKWVKQLDAAKVKAEDLPETLRAVALSSAALGEEGVSEFMDQLKDAKGEAGKLAKEVNSKLGGIVAKRMMGLDQQATLLKKNIGSLFGGLNIEPVLEGMRILVDLFDENTEAGRAMKFLFEEIFQPIIDQATNAAYVVEAFILGFLIGMTKLYIGLKPTIKAVTEFFGFEDTSLSDVLAIATKAGEYAAIVFAGFVAALVAIGVVFAVVVAAVLAIQVAIYAMIAALVAAVVYVDTAFINAFIAVKDYLVNLGGQMVQLGTDLIMGLVQGIKNAAGAVVSAVTGAVGGAIDAAKKTLGIASPSKVFAEIGGFTAEGFTEGVDDGSKDAQAAMASMVEPPDAAGAAPYTVAATADRVQRAPGAAAAGGSTSGGPSVNIYGDIYFAGAKATESEKQNLAEELTRLLEGDAMAVAGEQAA